MKIGYYLDNTSKKGSKLAKKSDMGRQVGQKWPPKIGYHMWMAPYIVDKTQAEKNLEKK